MYFLVGEKVSLIWPIFPGASWWFRQGQRRSAAVNGVADLPMKKRCQPLPFLGFTPHTPWKINMEPTNHPFRKENDLPNLHEYVPC